MDKTFTPCEDCPYSYSKNGQDMGMCEICELTYFANETKKLTTELKTKKQEWISVENRIPNKHELVLTYYNSRGAFGTDFITSYGEWFEIHENGKPTHWQPLPTPPKMKGE